MKADKIFFTSDHHWGHAQIIKHSKRFEFMDDYEKNIVMNGTEDDIKRLKISDESVQRMKEAFIHNWNKVVPKDGTVFYLGDMFLCNVDEAENILDRLNGTICLITGNHEKTALKLSRRFLWTKPQYDFEVEDKDSKNGVRFIVLYHYPIEEWNRYYQKSWHLFGHVHGNHKDNPNSLKLDVGIDSHDYTPISYARVKELMALKTWTPIV